ncbi:MarR family winged helix-turn-helix transcriptional regulator [Marisediminicola sp. LYQ134]|uniref:MarR family winged helix-turn-helix transcriptional regulator n=1 Tax=unclassified Marisediminicola TaxID=2618316 RepID=UPI003983CB90
MPPTDDASEPPAEPTALPGAPVPPAPHVPESAADDVHDWPTGRLLSTAARLVEHAWSEALESIGLTHAGLIVLHLLGAGPLNQTELARAARVEAQTMSRTIHRLERDGFVRRTLDPADARRRSVERTDAGTEVWRASRTLESDVFPSLSDTPSTRAALLEIIRESSERRW